MAFSSSLLNSSGIRSVALVLYLLCAIGLIGCQGNQQSPVLETFKLGITNPNTVIDQTPLNPNFRYLKVEANGLPALLVLGYLDQHKSARHDVWYSAFKEVVELKEGRLGNTEGLELNWTQVKLIDAPPIADALINIDDAQSARSSRSNQFRQKLRYTRIRTVMPGYHVNIRETVIMQALDSAPSGIPKQLRDPQINANIRWVEETVLVPPHSQNPSIKPLRAIYAVDIKTKEVIYGKQYLTPDFYVSWLTWPYPPRSPSRSPTP
jgi:hypothetical protein